MKLIDRYIIKEIIPPALISFILYTAAFLMNQLVDLAEIAVKRDVSFAIIGKLIMLSIPHIVAETAPMAFLLGILIAFGRLSKDSEVIACLANGISYLRLLKPVMILASLIFLFNLYLMFYLLPAGNTALQDMKYSVFSSNLTKAIEPRIFFEDVPGILIYADESERNTSFLSRVFINEGRNFWKSNIIVAERATISSDKETGAITVNLINSENHTVDLKKPDKYQLSYHREQTVKPDYSAALKKANSERKRVKSDREQNLPELLASLDKYKKIGDEVKRRKKVNSILVEIHKKIAIPFVALVFGLLGVPLGISTKRGGKASGFAVSLIVFLLYWIFLWGGERASDTGNLPPSVAMWMGNIVFIVFAFFLIFIKSKNIELGLSGLKKFFTFPAFRRKKKNKEIRNSFFRFSRGPLSILDSYILSVFCRNLLLVLLSFFSIFIVVELIGLIDEIMENNIAMAKVVLYFVYSFPRLLIWTLPLSVLVTVLINIGVMSKNNEIIAMQVCGVSSRRTVVPLLVMAMIASVTIFVVGEKVLPRANMTAQKIEDEIRGRSARTYTPQKKRWVFGEKGRLYNYAFFNPEKDHMQGLSVFAIDDKTFHIRERLFAEDAQWKDGKWIMQNGWFRSFEKNNEKFEKFESKVFAFPEDPYYFGKDRNRKPDMMDFVELKNYIKDLAKSGYKTISLQVSFHKKFSFALVPFLLALVGIPFAFTVGKKGGLYGIGAGILIGMIYHMMLVFFTTLGSIALLPPFLAAWAANIIFGIIGLYFIVSIRT